MVRPFAAGDAPGVVAMLQQSVRMLAPADYDAAQVAAWAARLPDAAHVAERAADGRCAWVAVDATGAIFGYSDVEADGHIDLLYVAPAAKGQGVADALTDAVMDHARAAGLSRLYVEASEAALRFYRKRGFVERARRDMMIDGVAIHNFAMDYAL